MIYSMTAYARREVTGDWGNAAWELRSVNQRYLETHFRLPEQFRALEVTLRERLRKRLSRGKVEVVLRFHPAEATDTDLVINEDLALAVLRGADWVQDQGAKAPVNPLDILRWPGVMTTPDTDLDAIQGDLLEAFTETLEDFISHRGSEGGNMKQLIADRLDAIEQQAATVREQMPAVMAWQRERLQNRFADAQVELNPERLEQEMVLVAQKVDVAEELDRLDSHIKECRGILRKGGPCGRRLDFMMQEFNREANTLASKSINADITAAAVEVKVLIEQMREQIQNIE